MTKLSVIFFLGVMTCALERVYSMGIYSYMGNQGALSYPYSAYSPYIYAPYAVAAAGPDCDKKKEEGSSESSSSSSSSESSSEEEKKEEKPEGSKESSEGGEEGGSKEEGEAGEKKEEGSSSSSSSSSEESEEKKGKKEKKEEKKPKVGFPPVSYPFPPRPAQQVVYSPPMAYSYVPMKSYSLAPQSVSYTSYPYYSMLNYPVSSGYSVKNYVASPVSSFVPNSFGKVSSAYSMPSVAKTFSYNPVSSNFISAPSPYWGSVASGQLYKA